MVIVQHEQFKTWGTAPDKLCSLNGRTTSRRNMEKSILNYITLLKLYKQKWLYI